MSRPLVISEEFWPQMQDSELELPEKIQKSFDIFKEEFTKQKVNFKVQHLFSRFILDLGFSIIFN